MNAHTKLAQQIAAEAGAPERAAVNARMIERQLAARNVMFDTGMREAIAADSARCLNAHRASVGAAEQRLIDVKAATRVLNDELRVRLAIYLIDGVDGIGEDDRFALNEILGEVQSRLKL